MLSHANQLSRFLFARCSAVLKDHNDNRSLCDRSKVESEITTDHGEILELPIVAAAIDPLSLLDWYQSYRPYTLHPIACIRAYRKLS